MREVTQSYPIAGQRAVVSLVPPHARETLRLQIWINNLAVGPITLLAEEQHRWECVRCQHTARTKRQLLAHVYGIHYRRMLLQQASRMPMVG